MILIYIDIIQTINLLSFFFKIEGENLKFIPDIVKRVMNLVQSIGHSFHIYIYILYLHYEELYIHYEELSIHYREPS